VQNEDPIGRKNRNLSSGGVEIDGSLAANDVSSDYGSAEAVNLAESSVSLDLALGSSSEEIVLPSEVTNDTSDSTCENTSGVIEVVIDESLSTSWIKIVGDSVTEDAEIRHNTVIVSDGELKREPFLDDIVENKITLHNTALVTGRVLEIKPFLDDIVENEITGHQSNVESENVVDFGDLLDTVNTDCTNIADDVGEIEALNSSIGECADDILFSKSLKNDVEKIVRNEANPVTDVGFEVDHESEFTIADVYSTVVEVVEELSRPVTVGDQSSSPTEEVDSSVVQASTTTSDSIASSGNNLQEDKTILEFLHSVKTDKLTQSILSSTVIQGEVAGTAQITASTAHTISRAGHGDIGQLYVDNSKTPICSNTTNNPLHSGASSHEGKKRKRESLDEDSSRNKQFELLPSSAASRKSLTPSVPSPLVYKSSQPTSNSSQRPTDRRRQMSTASHMSSEYGPAGSPSPSTPEALQLVEFDDENVEVCMHVCLFV